MSQAQIGFVRALGVAVLMTVLAFLGNAANLNGVLSTGAAALISALALSLEHFIEGKTGNALFGAVTIQR